MTNSGIIKQRLINQQILGTKFTKPEELVAWFGGIQAQSYGSSKWAIGSRIPGLLESDVEKAIADKKIIRTWLMRYTIHLVAAEDLRWLINLLSQRLIAQITPRIKWFGIEQSDFNKSNKLFIKALRNGVHLTSDELAAALKSGGINASGLGLAHLLRRAALDQTICFGCRRGKQFTYTLLDEFIPDSVKFERDQALANITNRYFTSRGPATIKDFIWWSGLTLKDAKTGIELAKHSLIHDKIDNEIYWFGEIKTTGKDSANATYLLPAYDEYLISYRNRNLCLNPKYSSKVITKNGIFNPVIINNGKVDGTWKPVISKNTVSIETSYFNNPGKSIHTSAKKYSGFIRKSLK
jgi:hypothetical protein